MNKDELVIKMLDAAKGDVTKIDGRRMLDAALKAIEDAVADGKDVRLIGFGTFKKNHRAARTGRNPQTGEALEIPAAYMPHFTAGRGFKEIVNK